MQARVDRSTLMALASRPERTEKLLATFEGGRRLTLAEAKALISGEEASPGTETGNDELGGIAGLQRLHAAKRRRLPDITGRMVSIVASIETALTVPRLVKSALVREIFPEARRARLELLSICGSVEPPYDRARTVLPDGSRWRVVEGVLYDLGGIESWPSREQLVRWLHDKVLPTLRWAAGEEAAGPGHGTSHNPPSSPPAAPLPASLEADESGETGEGSASYELKLDDASENVPYELRVSPDADWTMAMLSGAEWRDAEGDVLRTTEGAALRIPSADTVKGERFLAWITRIALLRGTAEDVADESRRKSAEVLADLMVCGRPVRESPGTSPRARALVAAALVRGSSDPSRHPQETLDAFGNPGIEGQYEAISSH